MTTVTKTVTVLDANNNPIAGATVSISVMTPFPSNVTTGLSLYYLNWYHGVTDENGVADVVIDPSLYGLTYYSGDINQTVATKDGYQDSVNQGFVSIIHLSQAPPPPPWTGTSQGDVTLTFTASAPSVTILNHTQQTSITVASFPASINFNAGDTISLASSPQSNAYNWWIGGNVGMSVDIPKLTIALGSVGVPQGDVVEAKVHLGATKEVSSWELKLQNWNGKYSPNGAYPLNVGQDGYICIGRGSNVPQIITTRTESIKFDSTPSEYYVTVAGRCWGEKLFRYNITKNYSGYKGEAIIKDILDYYAGISHVRGGVELVANTDTTFNALQVSDKQAWTLLKEIAAESDLAGVIGFDFRTTPDGKFEFFPRGSKTCLGSLANLIESYQYWKEITAIRNKVTIYGAKIKSVPLLKVDWTQSLTPTDGVWTGPVGTVSLETAIGSPYSIKLSLNNNYFGELLFTLNTGHLVNAELYPELDFAIQKETYFNSNTQIVLYDATGKTASRVFTVQSPGNGGIADQWTTETFNVGSAYAINWSVTSGFDWTQIWRVAFYCFPASTTGSGSFWVDKLYFGGRRYSSVQQDTGSQSAYGLREYVDTNEELYSDNECTLNALATLAYMKDPFEYITLKSTIIDYGNYPIFPGDMITVSLPNENVNGNYRILSVEYDVKAASQELEITLELGHEKALLADYLYALRSKLGSVNRYKVASYSTYG